MKYEAAVGKTLPVPFNISVNLTFLLTVIVHNLLNRHKKGLDILIIFNLSRKDFIVLGIL